MNAEAAILAEMRRARLSREKLESRAGALFIESMAMRTGLPPTRVAAVLRDALDASERPTQQLDAVDDDGATHAK